MAAGCVPAIMVAGASSRMDHFVYMEHADVQSVLWQCCRINGHTCMSKQEYNPYESVTVQFSDVLMAADVHRSPGCDKCIVLCPVV